MRPDVSVIVPNYNHARYLPRRVGSVLGQTAGDLEVILLDDASTDGSLDVLRRYAAADSRVRLVPNAANSGSTFRQWNKGFGLATGEFVWLAESDDYADPRLLERLLGLMRVSPGCALAYCQSYSVDADDRVVGDALGYTADLDPDLWRADFVLPGADARRRFFVVKNVIPNASAVLIRRSVIDRVGGADSSLRLTGDWKFWADALAHGDLAYAAERLNYFRRHDRTVRAASGRSGSELVESHRVIRSIASSCGPDPSRVEAGLDAAAGNWMSALSAAGWPAAAVWRTFWHGVRTDPRLPVRVARRMAGYPARVTGRALRRGGPPTAAAATTTTSLLPAPRTVPPATEPTQ